MQSVVNEKLRDNLCKTHPSNQINRDNQSQEEFIVSCHKYSCIKRDELFYNQRHHQH